MGLGTTFFELFKKFYYYAYSCSKLSKCPFSIVYSQLTLTTEYDWGTTIVFEYALNLCRHLGLKKILTHGGMDIICIQNVYHMHIIFGTPLKKIKSSKKGRLR